jgi:hypothetical protein
MLRSSTKMTTGINIKNIALLHITHIIFINSPFFALLYVTTWIWIEMKKQLIGIIDD